MLKKISLSLLCIVTFASANSDKWFMELGYKISMPTTTGYYNSFDSDGVNGIHYDWEGTDDMLYAEFGRIFSLENQQALLSLSLGTTFIVLDSADHHNAFFVKSKLLYPFQIFGQEVYVGPTAQVLFPYNSYYYDDKDGQYARKVTYDTTTAYSFGIDTVWGKDTWKYTFGVDYMTSAKYKGETVDSQGYANSEIDLNGVYVHIGLQYQF